MTAGETSNCSVQSRSTFFLRRGATRTPWLAIEAVSWLGCFRAIYHTAIRSTSHYTDSPRTRHHITMLRSATSIARPLRSAANITARRGYASHGPSYNAPSGYIFGEKVRRYLRKERRTK